MKVLVESPPLTIFCIEDEVDLREVLVEELQDAGYEVVEAADGTGALAALAHTRPDLILCDIIMPGMGGYELLHRIRTEHTYLADVPFIFLTAQDGSGQIVSGKHAGADDYLVKPVDFDLMLATIQARLRQVQRFREKITQEAPQLGSNSTGFQRVLQTFDLINAGIILLNNQSSVLFMNSAASRLINTAASPCLTEIISYEGDETYWHHKAIREAIQASQKKEDYIDYLSLARNDGQRDLLLTLCALTPLAHEPSDPAVALFFCQFGRNEPTPIKALEALFQLTPMESRVAWAFAQGMRAEQIAQTFSISATTVAFHKRNIFQKTHTNRQADLIALLLTLPVHLDGFSKYEA